VQTGRVTRYSHRDHRDVCYSYRAIGIGIPRAALLKVSRLGRDFRRRLSKFCRCVFLRQKSVSVYAESFSMSRDAHYRRARHKSPAIPPSGASRMKNTASLIRRGAPRVRSSRVESELGHVSSRGCLMRVRLRAASRMLGRDASVRRLRTLRLTFGLKRGGDRWVRSLINEVRTRDYLSADASNLSALLDSTKNRIYDPVCSASTPMNASRDSWAITLVNAFFSADSCK